MINIPGHLVIRTISGRHGDFNVGRLVTSLGEFVVKDALLDQYTEGKYDGHFVIIEIRPASYTHSGRLVVEVRARLDSMTLDGVDDLTQEESDTLEQRECDPLEEESPPPAQPSLSSQPPAPPSRPAVVAPHSRAVTKPSPMPVGDDAPFGMDIPTTPTSSLADEQLFGTVWPLGAQVKLDPTVSRQLIRDQKMRLEQLGYRLDFRSQLWVLSTNNHG